MSLHLESKRKENKRMLVQLRPRSAIEYKQASLESHLAVWKRLGCSLLLFGLFTEWLHPLAELQGYTDLQQLYPLSLTILSSLLIGVWAQSAFWRNGLKLGVVLFMTIWVFGNVAVDWPERLGVISFLHTNLEILLQGSSRFVLAVEQDVRHVIQGITEGEWMLASGEVRTFLLLAVVMVLASLVQSLMLANHSVLLFCTATGIYLLFLQAAIGIDTSLGLVRTVAWSAALAAWVRMLSVSEQDGHLAQAAWPTRWWLLTIGTSAAIIVLFAGWNQLYSWEKPRTWPEMNAWIEERLTGAAPSQSSSSTIEQAMAFQQMQAELAKQSTIIGRTGYGENDEQLGAPLAEDHRILFTAVSPEPTYWKLEVKSDYTGKGWTSPELPTEWVHAAGSLLTKNKQSGEDEQLQGWSSPFTQSIAIPRYDGQFPLAFGGRPERLTAWEDNEELPDSLRLKYEPAYERYRLAENPLYAGEADIFTYSYQTRTWNGKSLPPSGDTGEASARDLTVSKELLQTYTTVPDSLPDRVRTLTKDITANAASTLDKASAIQAFLQQNYAYTKVETKVPRAEADFVDAFLFEQKQGYCVHFSTAMAVMLRTQGIPTRWVKGFAPGESSAPGQYTVRASDAHAWVEVYEPSMGWIPFEATPASGVGSTRSLSQSAEGASSEASGSLNEKGGQQQLLEGADVVQPPSSEAPKQEVEARKLEELSVHPLSKNGGMTTMIRQWGQETIQKLQQTGTRVYEYGLSLADQWNKEREWLSAYSEWHQIIEIIGLGEARGQSLNMAQAYPLHLIVLTAAVLLLIMLVVIILHRWVRRKLPFWRMNRLIHAQKHHYEQGRVQQMGELAWRLIERKYGSRPRYMTLEEYSRQLSDAGLTKEQSLALQQFAEDCQMLLFARHQGDRIVRKRFLDGCLRVLSWAKSKDHRLSH